MKKHLRLRGENWSESSRTTWHPETPPLTRRKHMVHRKPHTIIRNTSAYAEKTTYQTGETVRTEKHLRLRGENPS